MRNREKSEMTSGLTKREAVFVLGWFPVHIFILPLIFGALNFAGYLDSAAANFIVYAAGGVYMLIVAHRFLRRDFDPLCDNIRRVLLEIVVCYGLTLVCNLLLAALLELVSAGAVNPNNEAVAGIALENYGPMAAAAVFLAPIVEELLFRAGLFGCLRKKSRAAAYAVSMLCFSLYHVWGYAVEDPTYWIYLVQYLPVSYLLCRCYERTNTVWSNILLHMLINGVAMRALLLLEELT